MKYIYRKVITLIPRFDIPATIVICIQYSFSWTEYYIHQYAIEVAITHASKWTYITQMDYLCLKVVAYVSWMIDMGVTSRTALIYRPVIITTKM